MHQLRTNVGHCGLLLILLGTALGLGAATGPRPTHNETEECTTPDCYYTAELVRQWMNTSVDPCEDFYEYACGSWRDQNPVPEDQIKFDLFVAFHMKQDHAVYDMLTSGDCLPEVLKVPKDFLDSCMNAASIQRAGVEPLRALLNELGGWPLLEGEHWNADNWDLTDTLVKLALLGDPFLFSFEVNTDWNNMSAMALSLNTPVKYALDTYRTLNPDHTKKYTLVLHNLVEKLGVNASSVSEEIKSAVLFDLELYSIDKNTTSVYQVESYCLKNMDADFPGPIQWSRFLQGLFENDEVGISMPNDQTVLVVYGSFFVELNKRLVSSDKRGMANFLMSRVAKKFMEHLSPDIQDLLLDLKHATHGITTRSGRPRHCISQIHKGLTELLAKPYVDKFVQKGTKEEIGEMIDELKASFMRQINDMDWLDEETKRIALEKTNLTQSVVLMSDDLMDVDKVSKEYNYNFGRNDYFHNVVLKSRQIVLRAIKKLRKLQDTKKITLVPADLNALYYRQQMMLAITASVIQVLFNSTHPKYLKYSRIGMTIGHEIAHGFDLYGITDDKLWTMSSILEFYEKVACLKAQYSRFNMTEFNIQVDGDSTWKENVADILGLQLSFGAYRHWVQTDNCGVEEKPLPGLGLTPDQLFFLGFAQMFCANMTPKSAEGFKTAEHAPDRFRVIGTLQNFDEFSKAFQCGAGTYMNSTNKCNKW